jgi:maleate isomerase
MPNGVLRRRRFGVLVPSTNAAVEANFCRMCVPAITTHYARIRIRDDHQDSDEDMERFLEQVRENIKDAVESIMMIKPDALIAGISAETFWGGVEGNRRFRQQIRDLSGLEVATGAEAAERALRCVDARQIGVLTPYQPIGDKNVVRFLSELGFEVVAVKGLRCPTAASVADVQEDVLRQALLEINSEGVDALVQVGTNLDMIQLADEAERWLGKPVIAINAAIWWMALRANGVHDKLYGCGRLLREH